MGNGNALRKTVAAGRAVGPGTLARLRAKEKMDAGGMIDAGPPSQAAVRTCIAEGKCPFCGRGPFAMVAIHTNKIHGVDKWELREIAGLRTVDPLCSEETSAKMSEHSRRNPTHVLATAALKARGKRPQRWTTAGRANVGHNLQRWEESNTAEARQQRIRAAWTSKTPEARRKQAEHLRQWWADHPEIRRERGAEFGRRMSSPEVRAKRAAARTLQPCGTVAAYKRGCRCDDCRSAKRASRGEHD